MILKSFLFNRIGCLIIAAKEFDLWRMNSINSFFDFR